MEPVQLVQMNTCQVNNYRKDLSYISTMSQGFKRGSKWRANSPASPFLLLIPQFQAATRSTSPVMTAVFHTWPYGRFIDMQSNVRRKKLQKTLWNTTKICGKKIKLIFSLCPGTGRVKMSTSWVSVYYVKRYFNYHDF